jgi:hypothetical protein
MGVGYILFFLIAISCTSKDNLVGILRRFRVRIVRLDLRELPNYAVIATQTLGFT